MNIRSYTTEMRTSLRRLKHSTAVLGVSCVTLMATGAGAQHLPTVPAEALLDRAVLRALDEELSGTAAKDHVARLAQLHRVPASPGFHDAIDDVMSRANTFGLSDVHVETFPGEGDTYFGTLHGNRGWRVDGGTLVLCDANPGVCHRRAVEERGAAGLVSYNSNHAGAVTYRR
jgi:hypothetical protein